MDKRIVLSILIPAALIVFLTDIIRFRAPRVQELFMKIFGILVREHEEKYFTGSTFLLLSAVIVISFFPKDFAIVSLMILTISDAAAALIGRKFGRIKIVDKTLEGSLAFLSTALVIGLIYPGISNGQAITAAVSATVIELIPQPLDDNFVIPVATCLILYVIY
ncbi:diacylglycerol/polyprenol kinase family protein [candidate division KSB1 bacterium]